MIAPALEVADVIRSYGPAYLDAYGAVTSAGQHRVLRELTRCRTAALGGHVEECDECGHRQIAYNSCRNRHCPKCQATAAPRWMEDRDAESAAGRVLPRGLHAPGTPRSDRLAEPAGRLRHAVPRRRRDLAAIAADPKHLGAEIGFLAVLHTWGQNLHLHPHVHCVVPGGGIALDGSRWIACRPGFFLPGARPQSAVPGQVPRPASGRLRNGTPRFHGTTASAWRTRQCSDSGSISLRQTEWVVYAKPPFGGRRAGAQVPGPLHAPGGDQQPSADQAGGRRGLLPLEGLRPRRRAERR